MFSLVPRKFSDRVRIERAVFDPRVSVLDCGSPLPLSHADWLSEEADDCRSPRPGGTLGGSWKASLVTTHAAMQSARAGYLAMNHNVLPRLWPAVLTQYGSAGETHGSTFSRRFMAPKHLDLKLVGRLEFGSGAVAMRYEPRR